MGSLDNRVRRAAFSLHGDRAADTMDDGALMQTCCDRIAMVVRKAPDYVNYFAMAQVLLTFAGSLAIYPQKLMFTALFGAIMFLLRACRWKMEWRIRKQRHLLTAFRKTCSEMFGLTRLGDIGPDDWERYNGSSYGTQAFTLVGVGLLMSFVWEGKLMGAASLITVVSYFFIAGISGSPSVIADSIRINVLSQAVSTFLLGAAYTEDSARRAIIIRTFGTMSATEPLDEIFVHLVVVMTSVLALRFGLDSSVLMLPLRTFMYFVVPIELLGLRPLLAKWSYQRSIRITPSNRVAVVTTAVPVYLVFFSYGKSISGLLSFYNLLVMINLALGVASVVFKDRIDEAVHPSLTVVYSNNAKPAGAVSFVSRRGILLTIALMCFVHGYFIHGALVLLLVAILSSFTLTGGQNYNLERYLLLAVYSLLFVDPTIAWSDSLVVMLSSSRLAVSAENRRFSQVAIESFALNALQILFSPPGLEGTVSLLCGSGLAVALSTAMMQENAFRLLKVVKNADSFLDHALKQKFSSVGAAINQVIETSSADFDSLQYQSLVKALRECRAGQNSCYLSSYAIQYQAGALQALNNNSSSSPSAAANAAASGSWSSSSPIEVQTRDLREVMLEWSAEGELSHCLITFEPTGKEEENKLELTTDFDLLKVLLSDMTKKLDNDCSLMLRVVRTPQAIQIQFRLDSAEIDIVKSNKLKSRDSEMKQKFILGVRKIVATALGGVLNDDALSFPIKTSASNNDSNSSSSPFTSPRGNIFTRRLSPILPVAPSLSSSSSSTLQQQQSLPRLSSRGLQKLNSDGSTVSSSSSSRFTGNSRELLQQNSSIGEYLLPPNLVFAVLDDSNIVRKSLSHMFKHHLRADKDRSFVTGATMKEALFFPQELCLKDVDVAIFDENLDYGDEEMAKGTALAAQARQRGFKKCAILHSANVELGKTLDPAFNGFVEKTSSREAFIRNIARIYDEYLRESPDE